jgi:hypothetical protein
MRKTIEKQFSANLLLGERTSLRSIAAFLSGRGEWPPEFDPWNAAQQPENFSNLFLDNHSSRRDNRKKSARPVRSRAFMLDQLTHATFEPLVGKRFRLHIGAEKTVEVELIQALELPMHPARDGQAPARQPFSLVFRGPRDFVLPQRIYAIGQETLGPVEIFLVPIGPDEMGQRYEAVFN